MTGNLKIEVISSHAVLLLKWINFVWRILWYIQRHCRTSLQQTIKHTI